MSPFFGPRVFVMFQDDMLCKRENEKEMSVFARVHGISNDIDSPLIPTVIDPSVTLEVLENLDTAKVLLYPSAA